MPGCRVVAIRLWTCPGKYSRDYMLVLLVLGCGLSSKKGLAMNEARIEICDVRELFTYV